MMKPRGSRKCFAPGCTTGYKSNKERLSLFSVPKNNLNVWSAAVPRSDKKLTAKDALCEKHFNKDDVIREVKTDTYSYALKTPRLKDNAVPCICPNCPPHLSKISKKRRTLIRHDKPVNKRLKLTVDEEENIVTPSLSNDAEYSVFNLLWEKKITLTLPSNSWSIHYLSNNEGDNLIALFHSILIEKDAVVHKKIMIADSYIKCYIFQYLYDNNYNKQLESIDDIQNILNNFDKVPVCFGLNLEISDNFSFVHYQKDILSKSWRHKKCKYVLEKNTLKKYCVLCQNLKRAYNYYLRKKVYEIDVVEKLR